MSNNEGGEKDALKAIDRLIPQLEGSHTFCLMRARLAYSYRYSCHREIKGLHFGIPGRRK